MTWATVTARRHKVVHQRGTIAQSNRRRSGNRTKQPRERTRKRHGNTNKSTFSYASQHINTSENLARRSIPVVLHNVATHIDKDHRRQHVMGTAQDADKEAHVRGREALRQNTRRTDASEHHLSASSPMRKKQQHKKFPRPTVCEHKTRPTRHMTPPQTNQKTLPPLTVCHAAVLYETSHTDLVCPTMMFPNDMTNHYSTRKS